MTQNETFTACPALRQAGGDSRCGVLPALRSPRVRGSGRSRSGGRAGPFGKGRAPDRSVKKHKLLLEAQEQYPDCLEVAQELLFLGRLYERSPRKLDFSVIKCHLLHFYLTPDDFSAAQQQQMRTELFEHPDLRRCQELAPDADAFTRKYLERLSRDFINVFLRGSNRYMHSFFG